MSINQPNRIHALGIFNGAAGVAVFTRGFVEAFTVNGPGDYTLTMDQAVDQETCEIAVSCRGLGGPFFQGSVDPTQPADNQLRIRIIPTTGQPGDFIFSVRVLNFLSATG